MLQHSASLYLLTVLIWGSTWFAIEFQLGVVSPVVSVAYRFALASALLLGWCRLRGLRLRLGPGQHLFVAAQGLTLFGFNYVPMYWANQELTSGLVAVIFSSILFMNIANGALFFGKPLEPRVLAGAVLGLLGIGLVFWPELAATDWSAAILPGVGYALLGTALASFGNMLSTRNQRAGLPVLQTNAWGMAYGAALTALWALLDGQAFVFDPRPGYLLSLLYLSLFGSVIAFGSYLTLLGRIGAERAAYATVLFPLVALLISTLFEGYQWQASSLLGMLLVLGGNVLALAPARRSDPLLAGSTSG